MLIVASLLAFLLVFSAGNPLNGDHRTGTDQAITFNPIDAHDTGLQLFQNGQRRDGLALLKHAVRLDWRNARLQSTLATAQLEMGELNAAMSRFLAVLSRGFDEVSAYNAAICAMQLERPSLCTSLIGKIATQPEDVGLLATCWNMVLSQNHTQGNYEQALYQMERAISLQPDKENLHAIRSAAMADHRDYYGALKALDDWERIAVHNHSIIHNMRGGIYNKLNQPDRALQSFKLGVETSQKDSVKYDAWVGMIRALNAAGRYNEAVQVALNAVSPSADCRWVLVVLAESLLYLNHLNAARIALTPLNQVDQEIHELSRAISVPLDLNIDLEKWKDYIRKSISRGALERLVPKIEDRAACGKRDESIKAAVVLKIGGKKDPKEWSELIRGLTLLTYFHNYDHCYDVVLFHEGVTFEQQQQLIDVVSPARVYFDDVSDVLPVATDQIPLYCCGKNSFDFGYRQMCWFFAMGMFHRPIWADHGYEWFWRLDSDSLILGNLPFDPIQAAIAKEVTYAFLSVHREPNDVVKNLYRVAKEWALTADNRGITVHNKRAILEWDQQCIYTNFEIGQLSWFLSPEYQDFVSHVHNSLGILKHRWGDGPIRFLAVSSLLPSSKIWRINGLPYAHKLFVLLSK